MSQTLYDQPTGYSGLLAKLIYVSMNQNDPVLTTVLDLWFPFAMKGFS